MQSRRTHSTWATMQILRVRSWGIAAMLAYAAASLRRVVTVSAARSVQGERTYEREILEVFTRHCALECRVQGGV